jgi:ribosomal protein L11 methylase PrmA
VWECTSDLLKYLATSNLKQEMDGKTVLDLGCGAGVLGIFALMNGAQRVDFQDYVS